MSRFRPEGSLIAVLCRRLQTWFGLERGDLACVEWERVQLELLRSHPLMEDGRLKDLEWRVGLIDEDEEPRRPLPRLWPGA